MSVPAFLSQPQLYRLPVLLDELEKGQLLIPRFQRPLVWSDDQRLLLLDSIRRLIPIGSVLVWRTSENDLATYDRLGPFLLPQPASQRPRSYLLDGHQRLSTLYCALRQGTPALDADPAERARWAMYFDLEKRELRLLPPPAEPPDTFVPLRALLYPAQLYAWQKRLYARGLDRLADEGEGQASRFKDYIIPVIPVIGEDLDAMTEAFRRINSQGTPLGEVHMLNALLWTPQFDLQEHLAGLAERLGPIGWGRLDPQVLVEVLKIRAGLPVGLPGPEPLREWIKGHEQQIFDGLLQQVEQACQLLSQCGVAGPSALPHPLQLVLLCEAAAQAGPFSAPVAAELKRWFWLTSLTDMLPRLVLSPSQLQEVVGHVRDIAAGLRSGQPPALPAELEPISRFDFALPRSRALALLLLQHGPLDAQGQPFTVERLALLEAEAVPRILGADAGADGAALDGPENRWLAAPVGLEALRRALRDPAWERRDEILRSHAIPAEAAAALQKGDAASFLAHRRVALLDLEKRFFDDQRAATSPAAGPQEKTMPQPAGLRPTGVPRVAVVGTQVAVLERAVAGAGLLPAQPGTVPPDLVVEELPAGRARIRLGGPGDLIETVGGPDGLAVTLCRLRAESLAAEGAVPIALWTYAQDDLAQAGAVFSAGALEVGEEPQWREHMTARFRARIEEPLLRIRQVLGATRADRWVLFYPKCHLGVAIRAGAVFHHQSGFWVDGEQNGDIWDLNRQPARMDLPGFKAEISTAEARQEGETHLLVSLSRDVRGEYQGWLRRASADLEPQYTVHITHEAGPGPSILPRAEVVDWADAVRQRLAPRRTRLQVPLRIFCAAPVTFGIALGRSLNAFGRVVTMDYSRQHQTYFASFDFSV